MTQYLKCRGCLEIQFICHFTKVSSSVMLLIWWDMEKSGTFLPFFLFSSQNCCTSACQAWCRTEAAVVKSAMENIALWWRVEFLADKRIWRKSIWIMPVYNKKAITVGRRKCWGFSKECNSAVSEVGEVKLLFDSFLSSHLETRNLSLQTLGQLALLISYVNCTVYSYP